MDNSQIMLDDIINKLYAYFLKWPLNNGVTNISSVKLVSLNPKTSKKLKAYRTTSKAKKKKKKKKRQIVVAISAPPTSPPL